MGSKVLEQKELLLKLDVSELNPQQIRLIKSINSMLTHVLTTDDECDYFDGSSELMRMVASAVKQANFTADYTPNPDIPYAEQALEFSIDAIADQIHSNKIINFDN
jgi:hypothetical protein